MAKMFYTLDEAKAALGKSEDELKQLAREGSLREFRDGPRLMFKASQVDDLRKETFGQMVDPDTLSENLPDDHLTRVVTADEANALMGIDLIETDPDDTCLGAELLDEICPPATRVRSHSVERPADIEFKPRERKGWSWRLAILLMATFGAGAVAGFLTCLVSLAK